MTRRRFAHCQNEKCNRRLGELPKRLEENDPPPAPEGPEFCEACLAMRARGWEDGLEQGQPRDRRAGLRVGFLAGAGTSAVVGLALWAIGHVAGWIAAAPPG